VTLTLFIQIAAAMPSYLPAQSLAEVARREAERRRELDRQGVEAKVIDGDAARLAPNGNVITSSPVPGLREPDDRRGPASRDRSRSYRSRIRRLDREIRSAEDRVEALRERLRKERWALPKVGRLSRSSGAANSQERLQGQISALDSKVKQLRRERREVWDEGRRAGFQPGELDGKGLTP
jgi:predicted RNase H-like nuclease (RuvC/YqgF family)